MGVIRIDNERCVVVPGPFVELVRIYCEEEVVMMQIAADRETTYIGRTND